MRKFTTILLSIIISVSVLQAQQVKIDPAFWWSGMEETELQLMVYGENIASYKPELSTENIKIKEVVTLKSPNYQLLYLDITGSQPEQFNIIFSAIFFKCFYIPCAILAEAIIKAAGNNGAIYIVFKII